MVHLLVGRYLDAFADVELRPLASRVVGAHVWLCPMCRADLAVIDHLRVSLRIRGALVVEGGSRPTGEAGWPAC